MPSAPLKAPNPNTSPLVRGGRYVMLALGVMYGSWSLSRLQRKEVVIQQKEDAIRAKRDARLAKEKEESTRVEMNELARECGVPNRL